MAADGEVLPPTFIVHVADADRPESNLLEQQASDNMVFTFALENSSQKNEMSYPYDKA